ncbi:DUF3801 domain-containing protein [Bacillus toyonensis]|uniref:DUF3801 domain-containing protein n=1 Tax=Bacillus toyonensis TaxID=155322 RepID=UPI0026FE2E28|nr:DUF3801 domain-containing protein [Bacillus toyonensis]MDO8160923.1 DUF3801 domain-containing protein [Bacillus toyonensis]
MVSVDEHTQVAMEVIAQSLKISEQTLLRLLEALSKLLEGKEQQPKDFIFDDKTKVGKQKISDLMKKHEKTGGIVALDENLTKQQLNDYQKELKKLGVDFSVVRNGKEDYSFFFSAAQANVIEKALKNIVERKSAVLEKEEVKTAEKALKEVRQDLTPDQAEKVKEVYDEITTAKKKEPKENNINYDRLSKQEKLLYAKLEELDEIKRGLYSQEVNRVEKLFENRYKQDVEKEPKLTEKDTKKEKTEVEIHAKDDKEQVKNMLNSLSNDEQKLMLQYTKVMTEGLNNHYADKSSYKESDKFDEMLKDFTPEQIEKVTAVVNQNIYADINSTEKQNGKIHVNNFQSILTDTKKEIAKENGKESAKEKDTSKQKKVEFSMDGVKDLDAKIKREEKEVSKDKNKKQSFSR